MVKREILRVRAGQEIEVVWNDGGHLNDEFHAFIRKAGEPIGLIGYLKVSDKEKSYCDPLVNEARVEELLQEALQKMKIKFRAEDDKSVL